MSDVFLCDVCPTLPYVGHPKSSFYSCHRARRVAPIQKQQTHRHTDRQTDIACINKRVSNRSLSLYVELQYENPVEKKRPISVRVPLSRHNLTSGPTK
jgi:hypothetical protein